MKNEYAFYMNIHDLYILMNQRMEQIGKNTGELSYGQYRILRCIAKANERQINQQQLVDETYLRRSTISQHLKRLTDKGYISHTMTKDDHRCKEIAITDAGLSALKKMDRLLDGQWNQVVSDSQIEDCNQLLIQVKKELVAIPNTNNL